MHACMHTQHTRLVIILMASCTPTVHILQDLSPFSLNKYQQSVLMIFRLLQQLVCFAGLFSPNYSFECLFFSWNQNTRPLSTSTRIITNPSLKQKVFTLILIHTLQCFHHCGFFFYNKVSKRFSDYSHLVGFPVTPLIPHSWISISNVQTHLTFI